MNYKGRDCNCECILCPSSFEIYDEQSKGYNKILQHESHAKHIKAVKVNIAENCILVLEDPESACEGTLITGRHDEGLLGKLFWSLCAYWKRHNGQCSCSLIPKIVA